MYILANFHCLRHSWGFNSVYGLNKVLYAQSRLQDYSEWLIKFHIYTSLNQVIHMATFTLFFAKCIQHFPDLEFK